MYREWQKSFQHVTVQVQDLLGAASFRYRNGTEITVLFIGGSRGGAQGAFPPPPSYFKTKLMTKGERPPPRI